MSRAGERIVEAIKEGLRRIWEKESEEHEWRPGRYYPSHIGYCLRRQFYTYLEGEEPTPEQLAILATGRGVHRIVVDSLRESGRVKIERVEERVSMRITDEAELAGRVDILVAEVDGGRVIVEVKSTSKIPSSPHPHHLMQIQVYLRATGLERGVLVYWDKRRGAIKAFNVDRDDDVFKRVVDRVVKLHDNIKRGEPPPKEAFLEGRFWECDSCAHRFKCKPFLVGGIPEGGDVVVSEIDGVLVDDTARAREALAAVGAPGGSVEDLEEGARNAYYKAYYSPELLRLDRRGPMLEYVWSRRARGLYLVIVTSRPESIRLETEEELRSLGVSWDYMFMRPESESPVAWKLNMLRRLDEVYRIVEVVDVDRRARRAASSLGLNIVS